MIPYILAGALAYLAVALVFIIAMCRAAARPVPTPFFAASHTVQVTELAAEEV